jgi:hypothetical protein
MRSRPDAEHGTTARLLVMGAVGVAAIGAAVAVTTYRNRPSAAAVLAPQPGVAAEPPTTELKPERGGRNP